MLFTLTTRASSVYIRWIMSISRSFYELIRIIYKPSISIIKYRFKPRLISIGAVRVPWGKVPIRSGYGIDMFILIDWWWNSGFEYRGWNINRILITVYKPKRLLLADFLDNYYCFIVYSMLFYNLGGKNFRNQQKH